MVKHLKFKGCASSIKDAKGFLFFSIFSKDECRVNYNGKKNNTFFNISCKHKLVIATAKHFESPVAKQSII